MSDGLIETREFQPSDIAQVFSLSRELVTRVCATCGRDVCRPSSHFSRGKAGPLAGLVFCNRECQKRKFRGIVQCAWPGCAAERLVEGPNFRRKQCKAYLCDTHTGELKKATGHRNVTQSRLNWLRDVPIGHRHAANSRFFRWTVLVLAGEKCADCKTHLADRSEYHMDHKVPVSEGGETRLSNMQPLCVSCHKRKSAGEQRKVNERRWAGRGPHNRHMTHVEKDRLIEKLRSQLRELGAEPAS